MSAPLPPDLPASVQAFVRDTIMPLTGPFVLRWQYPWQARYAVMPQGMKDIWDKILGKDRIPAGQMLRPDTVEVYRGAPDPLRTAIHEAGHIWDYRGIAPPQVTDGLLAGFPTFEPRDEDDVQYKRTQNEYNAEAFARALDLVRKKKGAPSDKDIAKLEERTPGTANVVRWILSQPPFLKP